jgi:hypothetical protein
LWFHDQCTKQRRPDCAALCIRIYIFMSTTSAHLHTYSNAHAIRCALQVSDASTAQAASHEEHISFEQAPAGEAYAAE